MAKITTILGKDIEPGMKIRYGDSSRTNTVIGRMNKTTKKDYSWWIVKGYYNGIGEIEICDTEFIAVEIPFRIHLQRFLLKVFKVDGEPDE